jgi:hypothetical protein
LRNNAYLQELLHALQTTACAPLCLLWPEKKHEEPAKQSQERTPPDRSMQFAEHYVRRRVRKLDNSGDKNQQPVDEQDETYKKPDWNDMMIFSHVITP